MNQAANDWKKVILNIYAVIKAAIIVMIKSLRARPKILAACTPLPGSPKAFAYGQGMFN